MHTYLPTYLLYRPLGVRVNLVAGGLLETTDASALTTKEVFQSMINPPPPPPSPLGYPSAVPQLGSRQLGTPQGALRARSGQLGTPRMRHSRHSGAHTA